MKNEELENILKNLQSNFNRLEVIESIAQKLKEDKSVLESIQHILEKSKTYEGFKQNSVIISYCIHILIQSQRPESMFLLIQHIKSLPESIPLKYVEFLGRLLPFFGKIIIGPAKELCQFPMGTPQHAVGIQILCNLFLDNLLGEENFSYLVKLINEFEQDPYFSKHLIDMVKSTSEYRLLLQKTKELEEQTEKEIFSDDTLLIDDSILVEKPVSED
jgi:hypothetical protein